MYICIYISFFLSLSLSLSVCLSVSHTFSFPTSLSNCKAVQPAYLHLVDQLGAGLGGRFAAWQRLRGEGLGLVVEGFRV